MLRAWLSSKNVTIRSFHFSARTPSETAEMIATWITSSSEMARMLPSTMVWMLTDVGQIDAISSPSANSEVKTRPITASSRNRVCCLTKPMPIEARMPAKNAPRANGKAEDIGARNARHDRMRERVAHQRPALEHQIGGQEGADAADQRAHPHGLRHVFVAEGHQQLGEQFAHFASAFAAGSSTARRRRSPAAARRR